MDSTSGVEISTSGTRKREKRPKNHDLAKAKLELSRYALVKSPFSALVETVYFPLVEIVYFPLVEIIYFPLVETH